MEVSYYRLKDLAHENMIIRTTVSADSHAEHKYVPGEGWVAIGIMIHYFCDESDRYDMYDEITEAEALALTEEADT